MCVYHDNENVSVYQTRMGKDEFMNNGKGREVMNWRKPFEGTDVYNQGSQCDRRIPMDEELLNHISVEVLFQKFKARKVEEGIYRLREGTTESKIYAWSIEYEELDFDDYDFDIRFFWNWSYGKESLFKHPRHDELVKSKERRVGGVQKRENLKFLKKSRK